MSQDWQAVATAINTRLGELGLTQKELAARSGLGESTIRQLQKNYRPDRSPRPYTLEAISVALQWPATHLAEVLGGEPPATGVPYLATEIRALRNEVAELRSRVDALELGSERK